MNGSIRNLIGEQGRLFGEPRPSPDEASFQVDNTSVQYFQSPYYLLHKDQLQPVPAPRVTPPRMDLGDVLGSDAIAPIASARTIRFHAVGDTGAAKVDRFQTAARAMANEASVADAMVQDMQQPGPAAPTFFYHLG